MDIYFTSPTGDELRIAEASTDHPRLQQTDRVEGWIDCHPKIYPRALFSLCVTLLSTLDNFDLLEHPDVTGAGITVEGANDEREEE